MKDLKVSSLCFRCNWWKICVLKSAWESLLNVHIFRILSRFLVCLFSFITFRSDLLLLKKTDRCIQTRSHTLQNKNKYVYCRKTKMRIAPGEFWTRHSDPHARAHAPCVAPLSSDLIVRVLCAAAAADRLWYGYVRLEPFVSVQPAHFILLLFCGAYNWIYIFIHLQCRQTQVFYSLECHFWNWKWRTDVLLVQNITKYNMLK